MLTRDVADASPSDVLITGQSMMAGSDCVTANLTILGSSGMTRLCLSSSCQHLLVEPFNLQLNTVMIFI